MKDFIPNGTGNSRFLKSVSNFLSLYPTYTDFVNALVAGTLPVDFNGVNSAGYSQLGTPLNKANILTDAVKALLWPSGSVPTDPSINDVLNRLSAGLLYDSGAVKNMLGQLVTLPVSQLDNPVHIATGSYTGTGTYGASNPCSLTFPFIPKYLFLYDKFQATNNTVFTGKSLTFCASDSYGVSPYSTDVKYTTNPGVASTYSTNSPLSVSLGATTTWYFYPQYWLAYRGWVSVDSVTDGASVQMNVSGKIYGFVAIG